MTINKSILIVLLFGIFPINNVKSESLNHKIFLEEIENSNQLVYSQCIIKYDNYLLDFPDDVSVIIEKCKFIQLAQYDDYEEINPNQEAFDSCVKHLTEKFPNSPEVLIFQTSYLWGDELKSIFIKAEKSIVSNRELWNSEYLSILYSKMADYYFWEEDFQLAFSYNNKAINLNTKYKRTLLNARLLIESEHKEEAKEVLLSVIDTTNSSWELSEIADLLIKLEAYSEALNLYKSIIEIDSTFNNNIEIANSLEAVGKYDYARSYLVADTSKNWNKETALRNLLLHDIKYQNGNKCISTYNKFRDIGYFVDPLGIYRLKIFLSHPLEFFKFRDILNILTLLFVIAILLIVPSIWVLPVYFVGTHYQLKNNNNLFKTFWGLKAFWFISFGYLLASFSALFVNPEILYSEFNSNYLTEFSSNVNGQMTLFFILIFAFFSFVLLYKKKIREILSSSWTTLRSISIAFGLLFLFRIIVGIYIQIGVYSFDISIVDIANISNLFLASELEIEAFITSYGPILGFCFICILVPFYEEIVFRGIVLDACLKYINFNSANIIQAFLFATIHQDLFLFPVFFLFGIMTGVIRKKTGGLFVGIIFHIINNILAISVFLYR